MSNVKSYTDKQLLDKVKSLPNFKGIPTGHWILGVRSNEDAEDLFDDKFYLFQGETFIVTTSGTTNPGAKLLRGGFKEYNAAGVAVLRSDMWHHKMWKFGKHKGKMEALVQVTPVDIYRDNDLDGSSEEQGKIYNGLFGINFHAATYNKDATGKTPKIGSWSAGCQVCDTRSVYNHIIESCKSESSVSYCLINEF